ncbi:dihydrolipoyl dehydrogenase [Pseudomarimonas salicorniae]|uniref:Dihydrolipoyl dehydrogenase n=1 Tax=Pseudomarimonas salicorniae TaxID=2933270 RepID=A0ABT0GFS9_9GAMM|nr:dihydrolipoyl dehydrogenase [Lysobacter sp. CAU 1642]MCK7593394.1 dihydrolipoyl dehydrogenase [Lysobacter sp. CAU 1642]
MAEREVDVAIIGAGTAGMTAFRAAREHTDDVWLIDPGPLGTTCARVGCMPSKLLIAAADAAHHVEAAAGFGVHAGAPRIDGPAVMQRLRAERDRFVGFVLEAVQRWPQERILRQRARFVAPMTLQLEGGERLRAGRIVIATGSSPIVPPDWREALGDRLLTSDDVFEWTDLPRSLAVVGAGVIGLELGQALSRLGVKVRILDRGGRPGGLTDPRVLEHARGLLASRLPLALQASVERVERDGEGVRVCWTRDGQAHEERFDALLCAIGRAPNLDGLDLDAAGLPRDARGRLQASADTARVGDSAVFVAGDAGTRRMLLHEAADEGRIAGDNAGRYPDVRAHPRGTGLAVVFSDPQIAIAGRSHAELEADGVEFACGALDFDDQGRSRVMRRNAGLIRVYGERHTGRFLGAEMIAPAAEHLAHLLAWSVHAGMTVQQMLDAPFYHPVIEEGVRSALRELNRALLMGPPPIERCLDCGPGA